MILYGDLDISVLDELPARRLPIKNCVVDPSYRQTACRFMQKEIEKGHQVYVICPMVEESEELDCEDVMSCTRRLREIFPEAVRIEPLHGRMKAGSENGDYGGLRGKPDPDSGVHHRR